MKDFYEFVSNLNQGNFQEVVESKVYERENAQRLELKEDGEDDDRIESIIAARYSINHCEIFSVQLLRHYHEWLNGDR